MKKKILVIIAIVALLAVSVPMSGCSEKVVLNVFNWGEYIDESLLDLFEERTGISINYKTYDTNETMLAKLEAGGSNFDVVFPSDYAVSEMIRKDLLLPLDYNNIPNYKYVDERFKNLGYDLENKYSVPYFWGTIGILYDKEKVEDPVDTWEILWNPKYAGQILMKKDVRDAMGAALKKLGYSMNSKNDSELRQAQQALIQQRSIVAGYYGDEIKDMIANGDAAMGLTYSGDFMELYWDEEADFSHIGFAVPKEGTNMWFDTMAIPKTCQHKKEAEMFINFMLDPDIAYQNAVTVGYPSPNTEAMQRIRAEHPEVFELDAFWPDDDIISRSEVYVDLGEYKSVYNQLWTEVLVD